VARDKSADLVEDIFTPGEAHLIGGAPGSGKTAFETWLCEHVLRGEDFLGRRTSLPPWWGAFIIDRGMEARQSFWESIGIKGMPFKDAPEDPAEQGIIPYYCLTEDPTLNPTALANLMESRGWNPTRWLHSKVQEMAPPRGGVLTIDVANFFGGDARLGYDKAFVSGWGFNKIARDFGITILALMHGSKQKSQDNYVRLIDRIIASTGFLGAVGTIGYLTSYQEANEGGLQLFEWQSHYCKAQRFKLRRTELGLFEMAAEVDLFEERPEQPGFPKGYSERWDVYLPWFPPEGAANYLPTMEIMKRALYPPINFSKRTVARDLDLMEEAGIIVRFKGERGKWQRRQQPEAAEAGE